jgi:hypothetical protein
MAYFEMTDREELLATYGKDVPCLRELVAGLGHEVLHFRPAIDGAWTIAEHVGHLASTEVNGYLRFQKAISNRGATMADRVRAYFPYLTRRWPCVRNQATESATMWSSDRGA